MSIEVLSLVLQVLYTCSDAECRTVEVRRELIEGTSKAVALQKVDNVPLYGRTVSGCGVWAAEIRFVEPNQEDCEVVRARVHVFVDCLGDLRIGRIEHIVDDDEAVA